MPFIEQPVLNFLEAKLLRRYSLKKNCLMYLQDFSVGPSQMAPLTLSLRMCLYQVETKPLICSANKWTGFNRIGASVVKHLKRSTKRAMITSFR